MDDGEIEYLYQEIGVRQGCTLAQALYCLGTHPLYEMAVNGLHSITAKAYADDFTAVGTPDDILKIAQRLTSSTFGLNPAKTMVYWPYPDPLPNHIFLGLTNLGINITSKGLKILGGFITHSSDERDLFLKDYLQKREKFFNALHHKKMTKQHAFSLLSLSHSQMTYLSRISPPEYLSTTLKSFDKKTLSTLWDKIILKENETVKTLQTMCARTHSASTDQMILQAGLPRSMGGLGISSTLLTSPLAYWAASVSCAAEVDSLYHNHNDLLQSTTHQIRSSTLRKLHMIGLPHKNTHNYTVEPTTTLLPTDVDTPLSTFYNLTLGNCSKILLQHPLSGQAAKARRQTLTDTLVRIEDKVRLAAIQLKTAGAWLTPNKHPEWPTLDFQDDDFTNAVRIRLGIPPTLHSSTICPSCYTIDASPLHYLYCKAARRQAATRRHDHVNAGVTRATNRAGAQASNEPNTHTSGPRLRFDAISHFPNGTTVLMDTTITTSVAPSHLPRTPSQKADITGHILKLLESKAKAKTRKYHNSHTHIPNSIFTPLVAESFGAIHPSFIEHLNRIKNAAVQQLICLPEDAPMYLKRLIQETSIALQKGNSWLLNTCNTKINWSNRHLFPPLPVPPIITHKTPIIPSYIPSSQHTVMR